MSRTARWTRPLAVALLAALGLVALTGCGDRTVHEVEVRPGAGRAFERMHDVWSESRQGAPDEADPEVRERLAAAWGRAPEPGVAPAPRVRLVGGFEARSPGAAGGEARLDRVEAHLGSVCLYTERFGLPPSASTSPTAERVVVESLVDLLAAYLRWHPEAAALQRLALRLERDGGRDLAGLVEGLRAHQAARAAIVAGAQPARAAAQEDPLVLAATLLVERGWLPSPLVVLGATQDGLADLLADAVGEPAASPARAAYRRLLAGPSGVEEPDGFEAFLASPAARASVQRANARRRAAGLPAVEVPACGPVDTEALAQGLPPLGLLLPGLWAEETELRLHLHTGVAPVRTNGAWDAARGVVAWRVTRAVDEPALRCFALWAVPDAPRQTRLLGAVRLTGESLMEYAGAFRSLDPAEQAAWTAAVESLDLGADPVAAVGRLLRGPPDTDDPYGRIRATLALAWAPRAEASSPAPAGGQ